VFYDIPEPSRFTVGARNPTPLEPLCAAARWRRLCVFSLLSSLPLLSPSSAIAIASCQCAKMSPRLAVVLFALLALCASVAHAATRGGVATALIDNFNNLNYDSVSVPFFQTSTFRVVSVVARVVACRSKPLTCVAPLGTM